MGSIRVLSVVIGFEEKGIGQVVEENGFVEFQNLSIFDDVGFDKYVDGSNIEFEFFEGDVWDEFWE